MKKILLLLIVIMVLDTPSTIRKQNGNNYPVSGHGDPSSLSSAPVQMAQIHNNRRKMMVVDAAMMTVATTTKKSSAKYNNEKLEQSNNSVGSRINGLLSLLQQRPLMLLSATIRIGIAMLLELALDAFMKAVVTPAITATGIGAAVAPATFLIEYAIQPIIHSIAFLVFDDRFLMAALDVTGIKERLLLSRSKTKTGGRKKGDEMMKWHKLGIFEGILTRYVVKSISGWCLGFAGLCTIIPVVGHGLTAFLTGWLVAWDYVYVPLSGMGYVGPYQQFKTVWRNFGQFQWYGFWAVLIEEIPVLGPSCHVYNVYSAAFFLEHLYVNNNNKDGDDEDDDATVSTVDTTGSSSVNSFKEL